MNLNNLENLKEEMRKLGFSEMLIYQTEEQMKTGVPEFKLKEALHITEKGYVTHELAFKQSSQSDFYFLNKYDVSLHKGQPLEDGKSFFVTLPEKDGKQQFKKINDRADAITLFKQQKGDSKLSMGETFQKSGLLASMENGKVNFIDRAFASAYRTPPITETIRVDRGKGFTKEQSANLIQGRTIYRDDMLDPRGETYKAWIKFDMEAGKKNGHFQFSAWRDPNYGFDLGKKLDEFKIKELENPKTREEVENSLKQGNRVLVTTEKDGQPLKVFIEPIPRFYNMNFFSETGMYEKREQFLKPTENLKADLSAKNLTQNKEQDKAMSIGR